MKAREEEGLSAFLCCMVKEAFRMPRKKKRDHPPLTQACCLRCRTDLVVAVEPTENGEPGPVVLLDARRADDVRALAFGVQMFPGMAVGTYPEALPVGAWRLHECWT